MTLGLDPAARWVVEYYPVQAVRRRRGGGSRWTWSSPTSAGCSGCCSGWPRTPGCCARAEYAESYVAAAREALSLYP